MAASSATTNVGVLPSRLKVFLSYSRSDSEYALELLTALELLGFDSYLDKQDIAPGEPWEERLGNLIRHADTVVFLISRESLKSKHCGWEVEETVRAGKRLVPVIISDVPNDEVPERLRKLNYVFFNAGQSFSKSLGELAQALRADSGWIREHTRYGELATRWIERNQPNTLLLRGNELDEAKKWATSRPISAPEVSANQQQYLEASAKTQEVELATKARLRWRVQVGLALASLLLALLASFSLFQWQRAEQAKGLLAATNVRLERKLALRAAPRGYVPYDVPAGWFQVATTYASAVAFIEKRNEPNRLIASGVLVSARALRPEWDDKPVFVTATYVVTRDRNEFSTSLLSKDAQLVMLGPNNERRTARLSETIWQSDTLGISISNIEDALPKDVTVINSIATTPSALTGLKSYSTNNLDILFDGNAMLVQNDSSRPIVFVGNLQGRSEVAISISHLLGSITEGSIVGEPNVARPFQQSARFGQSRGIDPVPISGEVRPDLLYTHGTLPGGGGSPIFDAETGDLIGIHLLGYPCPQTVPEGRRCAAAGTSARRLLTEIRSGQ